MIFFFFIFRQKKLEKAMEEEGLPDEEVQDTSVLAQYVA